MSIRNKNGIWYYEFMVAGKRYCGTCLDESGQPVKTERAAVASEKAKRAELVNVRANKSEGAGGKLPRGVDRLQGNPPSRSIRAFP